MSHLLAEQKLAAEAERVKAGITKDSSLDRESKDVLDMSRKSPVVNRKVNHVHKLERKHSSGDLHSRLKTRKLLGVGETDDGDVHRSKLSQILGHSEQLYMRLPRGLRLWQLLTASVFSTLALWALFLPASFYIHMVSADSAEENIILPIRLYGAALLSLSMMFWMSLQSVDKDVIRWSLLASAVYCLIQIIVVAAWSSLPGLYVALLGVASLAPLLPTHYYFSLMTRKPAGGGAGAKYIYIDARD